jgi:hypothetical protein
MLLTCYEISEDFDRLFVTPDVGGKCILFEYHQDGEGDVVYFHLSYEDAQDLKRLLYKWSMDIQAMENRDNV